MKPTERLTPVIQKARYKRRTTAEILDVSIPTIKRYEQEGLLRVIRETPTSNVFHSHADVMALARAKTNPSD